jgi:hypothetical protein
MARTTAYPKILLEMFRAVFSSDRSQNFNLNGQYLYTYNDAKGATLYHRMGFHDLDDSLRLSKDGVDWIPLGMSPTDLLNKLADPSFLGGQAAQDFTKDFQEFIIGLQTAQGK